MSSGDPRSREPLEAPVRGAEIGKSRILQAASLGIAVTLPWSSDLSLWLGVFLSRAFVLLQLMVIGYWVLCIRRPFGVAPRAYGAFVAYVAIHTIVAYGWTGSSGLFVSDYGSALGHEAEHAVSRIVVVAKFFLFAAFGFALAATSGSNGRIPHFGLGLGVSLFALLVYGRSAGLVDDSGRYTGGYANANAFAEVCLATVFFNAYTFVRPSAGRMHRAVAVVLTVAAVTGLLMSASRSALVGLAVGFAGIFAVAGRRHRGLLIGTAVGILLLVVSFSSEGVFELVYRRSTESVVNLRTLIWVAYLQQWREFLPFGVGLGREMSVLQGPIFMERIWPPHNTLLQVTVAYGVLGPALLLAFMMACVRRAWQLARRCSSIGAPAIALGLLLCWLMLMATGDRLGSRVFWLVLGTAFAVLAEGDRTMDDSPRENLS